MIVSIAHTKMTENYILIWSTNWGLFFDLIEIKSCHLILECGLYGIQCSEHQWMLICNLKVSANLDFALRTQRNGIENALRFYLEAPIQVLYNPNWIQGLFDVLHQATSGLEKIFESGTICNNKFPSFITLKGLIEIKWHTSLQEIKSIFLYKYSRRTKNTRMIKEIHNQPTSNMFFSSTLPFSEHLFMLGVY